MNFNSTSPTLRVSPSWNAQDGTGGEGTKGKGGKVAGTGNKHSRNEAGRSDRERRKRGWGKGGINCGHERVASYGRLLVEEDDDKEWNEHRKIKDFCEG